MVGISIDPRYKADKTRFLCKNLRGPPNGLVSREAPCRGNRSFSGLGRVFVAPCLGCVESVDAECHYVLRISLIGIGELSIYSSWRGFHAFIFVSGVSVYLFFFWFVWVRLSGRSVTIVIVLRMLFCFVSFRRCVSSFLYVLLGLAFGGCDFVTFEAANHCALDCREVSWRGKEKHMMLNSDTETEIEGESSVRDVGKEERAVGNSNATSMLDHDGETTDVETPPRRPSSQVSGPQSHSQSDVHQTPVSDHEKSLGPNASRDDRILVGWDGDDDQGNPRNWSTLYKSWITFQLGMLALSASLGSSIISPAGKTIAAYVGVGSEVSVLSISLYM